MKSVQFNLPVFVFFDDQGTIISYRHHECENLYVPLENFKSIVESFNPSVPNSLTTKPSLYHIPITLKVDDADSVFFVDLDHVENVYGKNHQEILSFQNLH